jgi:hypothetical protein
MPRYYPNGKRCQINIAIDADAYEILMRLAPSKRAYGHMLSRMLRDHARETEEESLTVRVKRLEEVVLQQ